MSATPPNPPQGPTPPAGANGPVKKIRRPKAADPLVRPKKKPAPRPPPSSTTSANGKPEPATRTTTPKPQQPQQPTRPQPSAAPSADDLSTNGFSGPLLSETYQDYPLVTTKRALREGLKFHVAKFGSKKDIDPNDEEQFTRPLRLQRRDPRTYNRPIQRDENGEHPARGPALTEAEREDLEVKKEARAKEREENLAQIAPSASASGGQKRRNDPKQKTQQVFKSEMTPQEIARARVRYEEALPWHLEDFDSKNIWAGSYEAALSDTYAMFVMEPDGKIRMVPIDKWYKFSNKNQFRALTLEEAEKHMAKRSKDPRWFMEKEEARAQQKELAKYAQQSKMYTGRVHSENAAGLQGDELDFEEDRFADDEEHVGLFDEDEDAQLADKRIKQDQLKANIFGLKEEKEYDNEELQEKKDKEALKNYGKRVRKALQKREKNFDYSSGSDANPYSEEESSDDTETERQKEEQKGAEEDPNKKEKGKESGTSTKGTNTPSDRPKHTDPLKKSGGLTAPQRKRPGSPNLSDASGTDTSRKKPKNKHAASAQSLQSQPPSRPMSPTPGSQGQPRKPQIDTSKAAGKKRARNASGSGSDADRAGSGPDMSEGTTGVSKKAKATVRSSAAGTPTGSRAGSPTPAGAGHGGVSAGGSRADSPDGTGRGRSGPSPPPSSSSLPFPTPAEIKAAIPATGISTGELIRYFKPRMGGQSKLFTTIVKDVGVFSPEDKLVRPRTGTE